MINLALEYSRYLMLLIVILYSILNLYGLRSADIRWQNRLCRHQMFLVFCLQALGYLIIFLKTREPKMLMFYGVQAVVFLVCLHRLKGFFD